MDQSRRTTQDSAPVQGAQASTDPSGEFPARLKVSDLRRNHAEYDADEIARFDALYSAGKKFRAQIDKFLVKRPIEKLCLPGANGSDHYNKRKEKAWYVPRGSGLLDWLTAAVFRAEPRIVAKNDPDGYWDGLNKDADGLGTDLAAIARRVLNDCFLVGRAAVATKFDVPEGRADRPDTLAARLVRLPAASITDWDTDENDRYAWVRTYRQQTVRSKPYLPADRTRETWTFYTPAASHIYVYTPDPNKTENDAEAILTTRPHDFGALPVFPVRVPPNMFVMQRVYDILLGLFDRETSITYGLDNLAYAILTFNLSTTDLRNIVDGTIGAMKLAVGESAGFTAPPPGAFDPLFKDCDRLKTALYEVIQAMSINAAATQTQNARQSAAAKTLDRDPLQTLLESFAWPVVDVLEQWVAAVKTYRGEEDNEVTIEGLDDFDATLEDAKAQIGLKSGGAPAPLQDAVENP